MDDIPLNPHRIHLHLLQEHAHTEHVSSHCIPDNVSTARVVEQYKNRRGNIDPWEKMSCEVVAWLQTKNELARAPCQNTVKKWCVWSSPTVDLPTPVLKNTVNGTQVNIITDHSNHLAASTKLRCVWNLMGNFDHLSDHWYQFFSGVPTPNLYTTTVECPRKQNSG